MKNHDTILCYIIWDISDVVCSVVYAFYVILCIITSDSILHYTILASCCAISHGVHIYTHKVMQDFYQQQRLGSLQRPGLGADAEMPRVEDVALGLDLPAVASGILFRRPILP